jgi:plasmid maintenance system antidote protein VapI
MSQNQLAHAIGVPGNRIHAIINGSRSITGGTDRADQVTPDTPLRLWGCGSRSD